MDNHRELLLPEPSSGHDIPVLVYGTLIPHDHHLFKIVYVPGLLYDLGWYPGFEPLPPGPEVPVVKTYQVYVSQDGLKRLDEYEGVRGDKGLYVRSSFDGAYIYSYNRPTHGRPVVPGGDWLEHKNHKKGLAWNS